MKKLYILLFILLIGFQAKSQDTFSIVAVDSVTGEVGSAGASCVNLIPYPNYTYHFLGELLPGVGAINTQAYYLASNQINARLRMQEGMTPSEIIQWLEENDVQNNPSIRQYGIVGFVNDSPEAAGYTGNNTDDYKNHVTGPNYSIQGNILLGQQVLDQMEYNFLNADGDLACRLMAALQGANMVGADTRCAVYGTSSLFAFVKVAQPEDAFGNPSFVLGLKTASNAGIEPIDSLQVLFDEVHSCSGVGIENSDLQAQFFTVSPNPAQSELKITSDLDAVFNIHIIDENGNIIQETSILRSTIIDVSKYHPGMYFIQFYNNEKSYYKKFIKL